MEPLPLIRAFALLVATVIGLYVCYLLVLPFLAALAISVLTTRAYRYLESRLTNASLAATISVILLAPLSLGGLASANLCREDALI
jgi:predicted PurR-regulated permease PerM